MILIVDNYDSFVHNLARYIQQLCIDRDQVLVLRNDSRRLDSIDKRSLDAIILSPGPCGPNEAGRSLEIVERFSPTIPILGVCLGHQAIVQSFGGQIIRNDEPMHGKFSSVYHESSEPLFQDIPSPFRAGRYHSLIAGNQSIPGCLKVIARTDDETIMAVRHVEFPTFGVQFHPESVLTEYGYQLLFNFLQIANMECQLPTQVRVTQ